MPPHPDAIADCVLAAFHALPAKCKPRNLPGKRREWVPLAGIVVSRGIDVSVHTGLGNQILTPWLLVG
jgi:hypothetical protein